MDALNVISREEVKRFLPLPDDFTADDDYIDSIIKAAVSWVEEKTSYRLYQRPEVFYSGSSDRAKISVFPIEMGVVTDLNGEVQNIQVLARSLGHVVVCKPNCTINAVVGYANPADAEPALIQACRKLITYYYENRDVYAANVPTDVQLLINPYRRSVTF